MSPCGREGSICSVPQCPLQSLCGTHLLSFLSNSSPFCVDQGPTKPWMSPAWGQLSTASGWSLGFQPSWCPHSWILGREKHGLLLTLCYTLPPQHSSSYAWAQCLTKVRAVITSQACRAGQGAQMSEEWSSHYSPRPTADQWNAGFLLLHFWVLLLLLF